MIRRTFSESFSEKADIKSTMDRMKTEMNISDLPPEIIGIIFTCCTNSVQFRNFAHTCRRYHNISKSERGHLINLKYDELIKSRGKNKTLQWAFYQGNATMIERMHPLIISGEVDLDEGLKGAISKNRYTLIIRYTSIGMRRHLIQRSNTLSNAIKPYVCAERLQSWIGKLTCQRIQTRKIGENDDSLNRTIRYLLDLLFYEQKIFWRLVRKPIAIHDEKCFHLSCPNSVSLIDDDFEE